MLTFNEYRNGELKSPPPQGPEFIPRGNGVQKKGGRPKAAFKSREETPKEGMCGAKGAAPQKDTYAGLKLQELSFGHSLKSVEKSRFDAVKFCSYENNSRGQEPFFSIF